MRLSRYLLLAVLFAVVSAAFWWIDFQVMAATTRANVEYATMRSDPPTGASARRATRGPLSVLVAGDDDFAAGVRKRLDDQLNLASESGAANVGASSGGVLRVAIADDGTTWTPIYSGGQMSVSMAYASDGDLSWAGKTPVVMPGGQPVVRLEGTVNVDSSSSGLISRRAYRRHLGEQAGAELAKAIAQALTGGAPTTAP